MKEERKEEGRGKRGREGEKYDFGLSEDYGALFTSLHRCRHPIAAPYNNRVSKRKERERRKEARREGK